MCTHLSHSILHTRQDGQIQWKHCSHYGKVVVPRLHLAKDPGVGLNWNAFSVDFAAWRPWQCRVKASNGDLDYIIELPSDMWYAPSVLVKTCFLWVQTSLIIGSIRLSAACNLKNHEGTSLPKLPAIACHSHIHSTSASTSIEFGSLWGHIPYHPTRVIGWSAQVRERSGAVWADTPPRDSWSTVEGPGTRDLTVLLLKMADLPIKKCDFP